MSANIRAYLEYFFKLSTPDPTAVSEDEILEYVRAYSRPGALRAGFAYYRAFRRGRTTEFYVLTHETSDAHPGARWGTQHGGRPVSPTVGGWRGCAGWSP